MNLPLDTHTFLWVDDDPGQLSPRAAALCRDPANTLFLSIASIWELQIKLQSGKLQLRADLPAVIADHEAKGLVILLVQPAHVYELAVLPMPHRDPFDRILVAQARVEQMPLVTCDPIFAQYPVPVEW